MLAPKSWICHNFFVIYYLQIFLNGELSCVGEVYQQKAMVMQMGSFGENFRLLLEEKDATPRSLSEGANIPLQTIYSWLRDESTPRANYRKTISEYFRITESDIFRDRSSKDPFLMLEEIAKIEGASEESPYMMPLFSNCPASTTNYSADEIIDFIPIPKKVTRGRSLYALVIKGDSMNQAGIDDGDIILVDATAEPRNGKIVIARVGDDCTCKVFMRDETYIKLEPRSSNPVHQTIVMRHSDPLRIMGVFEAVYMKYLKGY